MEHLVDAARRWACWRGGLLLHLDANRLERIGSGWNLVRADRHARRLHQIGDDVRVADLVDAARIVVRHRLVDVVEEIEQRLPTPPSGESVAGGRHVAAAAEAEVYIFSAFCLLLS